MSSSFRPIGDLVLIERAEEDGSFGKIFIPHKFRDRQVQGKVVAVGRNADSEITAGDYVVFELSAAVENAKRMGDDMLLVPSGDCLAKVVD